MKGKTRERDNKGETRRNEMKTGKKDYKGEKYGSRKEGNEENNKLKRMGREKREKRNKKGRKFIKGEK